MDKVNGVDKAYDLELLRRRKELLDSEYDLTVTELIDKEISDDQAFWLEQALIGIGMEKEEIEEEIDALE